MSNLHLRINWALVPPDAESSPERTGAAVEGPEAVEEHPVFLAAGHPVHRSRGAWDPSTRSAFPDRFGDDDPGPEECA